MLGSYSSAMSISTATPRPAIGRAGVSSNDVMEGRDDDDDAGELPSQPARCDRLGVTGSNGVVSVAMVTESPTDLPSCRRVLCCCSPAINVAVLYLMRCVPSVDLRPQLFMFFSVGILAVAR